LTEPLLPCVIVRLLGFAQNCPVHVVPPPPLLLVLNATVIVAVSPAFALSVNVTVPVHAAVPVEPLVAQLNWLAARVSVAGVVEPPETLKLKPALWVLPTENVTADALLVTWTVVGAVPTSVTVVVELPFTSSCAYEGAASAATAERRRAIRLRVWAASMMFLGQHDDTTRSGEKRLAPLYIG
jgi:hypothetical protein